MVRLNTRTGRISTIRAPSETYHTLLDADGYRAWSWPAATS
jgi:hypothetical protein